MELELKEHHVEESILRLNHFDGETPTFKISPSLKVEINKGLDNLRVVQTLCIEGNEENPTPFDIYVRLVANFKVIKETFDIIKIRSDCGAIVFPYLRAYVANLTLNAGIPAYHLPIVDFDTLERQVPTKFKLREQPKPEIKIIPPETI